METQILQILKKVAGHGYMRLLIGAVLIFTGIRVFLLPVGTGKDFSSPFAWAFLAIGITEMLFTILNTNKFSRWGWLLAGGLADLIIGISLASHPQIFMAVLPAIVSFVVLLRSLMAFIWFTELRKRSIIQGKIMMAAGILGLFAAVYLFLNPVLAGLRFVQGTSAAFVLIGFFEVYLSFCISKSARVIQ